jgi:outer membrane immunogenic protein
MKQTLLVAACVAGSLLASGTALAADMPLKAPPAPKPYNWYGFFVGGTAGYAWGADPIDLTYGTAFPQGLLPATEAGNPRGFIGGIEYGTNYQFGRWVLGTESDYMFSNITSSQTTSTGGFTSIGSEKLSTLSTSRGRVGYTIRDNLLLFGTAGLAEGTAKTSVASSDSSCPPCFVGSISKARWGWTAGAGIEYAQGPWSVKVEYLHYDLGDLNLTFTDPTGTILASTSTHFAGDIVRGGVNYHFTWAPEDLIFGRH